MSAGGHTVLTLAGGRWSPGNYRRHCEANLAQDFQSCVGLTTRLTGVPLDGLKLRIARSVISHRYEDDELRSHTDPRIAKVGEIEGTAGVERPARRDPRGDRAGRVCDTGCEREVRRGRPREERAATDTVGAHAGRTEQGREPGVRAVRAHGHGVRTGRCDRE